MLTNPASVTNDSLNTFTAPANTPTLAAGTSYFVVVEAPNGSFDVGRTSSDNEDAGGASGWTINNSRHSRNSDTGSWTTSNFEMRIAVSGSVLAITNAAPTAANGTVTTNEDTAYTFAASDFGFNDTDTGDTLASVKVTTLPAANTGTLALSGTAVTLNQEVTKAQIDANSLTYTPLANANGTGYASFGFKVNDGTDESAAAYTMTIDVTAVNDAATGAPTITGTAQVGHTLTANLGSIADVDELPTTTFPTGYNFQWIQVDGSTETDISGATMRTYALAAADSGKTVKVRVSFTDAAGNAEARTSAETAVVVAAAANNAPTAANGTVTTTEDTAYTFAASDFGYSDSDTGDTLASVKVTTLPAAGTGTLALSGTAVTLNQEVTKAQIDANSLTYTPPANANGTGYASFGFKVNDGTDESAAAYTMTIDVTAVNDAATGAPTITGTAQVDQTLTANRGTIADDDGLPSGTFPTGYDFQWIQVDGGTETDISGATLRTYTLAAADAGKTVKVRVSFTDAVGNAEARTSAAHPPSGGVRTVCNTPTLPGRTVIATTTVTVGSASAHLGGTDYGFQTDAASNYGSLSGDSSFSISSQSHTILRLAVRTGGGEFDEHLSIRLSPPLSGGDRARLQAHVCGQTFSMNATSVATSGNFSTYSFSDSGLDWSSETTRTVRFSVPTAAPVSENPLVSNLGQYDNSVSNTGNPRAMRFTTGSSPGGYSLSSVNTSYEDIQGDRHSLTLCPTDEDGFPAVPPTEVITHSGCVTLTPPDPWPPGTLVARTLTFTAPANTLLAPRTTYSLIFLQSVANGVGYSGTLSDSLDATSASGWSIGDRYEFYHSSGEWRRSSFNVALVFSIRGSAVSGSPSSDATLSALALSEGTLIPTFSSTVENYVASVEDTVSRITVTATPNHVASIVDFAGMALGGPTVAYFDGNDRLLADADETTPGHQVDLSAGVGTIKVKVTAGNGTTTKTYRVNLPGSDDATLVALELSGGVLDPVFSSTEADYAASVAASVSRTTMTATASHRAAIVAYLDLDYRLLTDADEVEDGFQVDLAEGRNFIRVRVTAADGIAKRFYKVVVERAPDLAADGEITVGEGDRYFLTRDDFKFKDSAGTLLRKIHINSLPDKGWLWYNGFLEQRHLPATVRADSLDYEIIVYIAPGGSGDDFASFTFDVSDGRLKSASNYTMTVNVAPRGEEPVVDGDNVIQSTIGQQTYPAAHEVDATRSVAQAFTTGMNGPAYDLKSIVVQFHEPRGTGTPDFDLYTAVDGGSGGLPMPGAKIADLEEGSAEGKLQIFTPASAVELAAGTTYFVVFRASGGSIKLASTAWGGARCPLYTGDHRRVRTRRALGGMDETDHAPPGQDGAA